MKFLIIGTVICLMGVFAFTDTGITSKRDRRFFFGLTRQDDKCAKCALIRQLQNQNSLQNARIDTLQALIARNARRCPTTAVGARRIGDRCYTVTTRELGFYEASQACVNMGGYLAEPPLTVAGLADFAADINTVFPGVATAYIGLGNTAVANTVQYLSSGAVLAAGEGAPLSTALIATGTVAAATSLNDVGVIPPTSPLTIPNLAALLPISAGAPLTFVDTTDAKAFICEYYLV